MMLTTMIASIWPVVVAFVAVWSIIPTKKIQRRRIVARGGVFGSSTTTHPAPLPRKPVVTTLATFLKGALVWPTLALWHVLFGIIALSLYRFVSQAMGSASDALWSSVKKPKRSVRFATAAEINLVGTGDANVTKQPNHGAKFLSAPKSVLKGNREKKIVSESTMYKPPVFGGSATQTPTHTDIPIEGRPGHLSSQPVNPGEALEKQQAKRDLQVADDSTTAKLTKEPQPIHQQQRKERLKSNFELYLELQQQQQAQQQVRTRKEPSPPSTTEDEPEIVVLGEEAAVTAIAPFGTVSPPVTLSAAYARTVAGNKKRGREDANDQLATVLQPKKQRMRLALVRPKRPTPSQRQAPPRRPVSVTTLPSKKRKQREDDLIQEFSRKRPKEAPPSTEASSTSKPTFAFGATKTTAAAGDGKPAFSFGGDKTNAKAPQDGKPAFTFGATSKKGTDSSDKKTSASAGQENKPFAFGATSLPTTTDAKTPALSAGPASKPAFAFGAAKKDDTGKVAAAKGLADSSKASGKASVASATGPSKPATISATTNAPATDGKPAFSFGAAASATVPASTADPSKPTLSFGAAKAGPTTTEPTSKPAFSFGSTASAASVSQPVANTAPTPNFAFGAITAGSNAVPSLGAAKPASGETPSFGFGATAPVAPGGGAAPSFSIGSGGPRRAAMGTGASARRRAAKSRRR